MQRRIVILFGTCLFIQLLILLRPGTRPCSIQQSPRSGVQITQSTKTSDIGSVRSSKVLLKSRLSIPNRSPSEDLSAKHEDKEASGRFKKRLNILKSKCPTWEMSLKKHWKANANFIVHYNRRILVCVVPKSGSSSWHMMMWAMRRLDSGFSADTSLYTYRDTVLNHETSTKLTASQGMEMITYRTGDDDLSRLHPEGRPKRIVLTRHPFARLISGWHQKFLPDSKYAELLMKRYSRLEGYIRTNDPKHQMSWKDFADFIISFKPNPLKLDYHFRPAWTLCNPCDYPYTYIVKSESVDRDEEWLLGRLNITDVKLGRHGVPPGGSLVNEDPNDKIKFYMKQLTDKTRRTLFEIYQKDFELYGYTFDLKSLESGGFL